MTIFSNVEHQKRNRQIEGETGVDLKIDEGFFLIVLAMTDANPKWTAKAQKAFNELNRLRNAGAQHGRLDRQWAELFADTIVIGWHGGLDDDDNLKPFGGLDASGDPVAFSRDNCVAYLVETDDASEAILEHCRNTKNFRARRADLIKDTAKNG